MHKSLELGQQEVLNCTTNKEPGEAPSMLANVLPPGITKNVVDKVDKKNSRQEISEDEQLSKTPRTSTPGMQVKFWKVPSETGETDFSDASVPHSPA